MPALDPINVGSILVAVIATFGGWASARSAAKTTRLTAKETAELEAYNRAHKMDLETIDRQDKELIELQNKYDNLKKRLEGTP
jgi:hypothetical protein